MEHQALENVAPISPYFVSQKLTQGLTTPSLGLDQTPTLSIATILAKDFGYTLPFERNTLVGTLNTNPPQRTTWKPTFGTSTIPEHPLHQHRPLTLHESTTISTYQGYPSSSIPTNTIIVPNIMQGSVD